MSSVPFTFRIDPETKASLEAAAKSSDRTPGYLAKQAISAYLAAREEKRLAIEAAIAEADKGVFVSEEAVDKWMDSWDSDNELPRPKPDIFRGTKQ
jgi:predicted transcriptional regulator